MNSPTKAEAPKRADVPVTVQYPAETYPLHEALDHMGAGEVS